MKRSTQPIECDSPHLESPPEELHSLTIFTGRWRIQGQNQEGAPISAHASVIGEEYYEWMPGNFFLSGKWNRQSDGFNHQGVSIIEYDSERKQFISHNYDNLGYARDYVLHKSENKWSFTGEAEKAVIEFSEDGNRFTEIWEVTYENKWRPLCMLSGTRVG